jgi:para-nitrobenzyl esterase
MGAYHGAELPYVFDTHDDWLPTSQVDRQLTDLIKRYWVNFATTGNPNDDDLTFWPQFTAQIPKVITLGNTIDVSTHSQAALCEFLGPRF